MNDRAALHAALTETLRHEGGYVNDPDDPGGETYMGISAVHHPEWPGWEDVRQGRFALAEAQVEEFYRSNNWEPAGCDVMPPHLAVAMFDTAVQHGVKRAVKCLQRALNAAGPDAAPLVVDGVFGKKTFSVLADRKTWPVLPALVLAYRACSYLQAIRNNHTLAKYAGGLSNRVESLIEKNGRGV